MITAKECTEEPMNEIKDALDKEKVISACSGGVDSTTATYLVHKAVGENLILTKGYVECI